MKILNATLIIALMLTSDAALAERGSGEGNRISYPDSAVAIQDIENRHYSFSNLKHRNQSSSSGLAERGSGGENRIVSPESTSATQHDSEKRHYSFSNFKHRNRKAVGEM